MKPSQRPKRPNFSSGPCAKRPGWTPAALDGAFVGRSHRAQEGLGRLAEAIRRTGQLLEMPEEFRLGIVPGSDTGAVEMAMWSLLGPRGVDVLVWESFSAGWATDATEQLPLTDLRVLKAPYGSLPDLGETAPERDTVFVWNGTTSGVRLPDGDWISKSREGLTICDATSAAFAMALPWDRLDVVTFSWQKCLGGEGGHGMIALGPRAVERLETYTPPWPLPKVFRMTKKGKFIADIFEGNTINTPSMLCVEDWLDTLKWGERIGGLPKLIGRAETNLAIIARWIEATPDFDFLAVEPSQRSCTSVCLKITAPWFTALPDAEQKLKVKTLSTTLADEGVAFDVASYRDAPPGLRLWAGPTVERTDIEAVLPWLSWALTQVAD